MPMEKLKTIEEYEVKSERCVFHGYLCHNKCQNGGLV